MFEIVAQDDLARTGMLQTRHGVVHTPFFMPVVTKANEHRIGPREYTSLGADSSHCLAADAGAVICNSLIASFEPGQAAVRAAGGMHGMLGFDRVIFSDSGGFQVSPESSFVARVMDKGIHFTACWSNDSMLLTPEQSMAIQQLLASDVAMVLDDMAPYGSTRERSIQALERTHRWAEQCLRYHAGNEQLLFGICQGGLHRDLRRRSATFIDSLGFDGIAIGGVALHKTRAEKLLCVSAAVESISSRKPRYVMGIGHPVEILDMVAHGIDCFDTAFPTIQARRGIAFTACGMCALTTASTEVWAQPLDEQCDCSTCRSHTVEDMVRQFRTNQEAVVHLLSHHNVRFMMRLMCDIRQAILEQRFESFRRELSRAWSVPITGGIEASSVSAS